MAGEISIRNSEFAIRNSSGFTMIEIAICLAIIGFALVAIIGVLPYGMNTQRDNREETVINQDATVLLEAIRSGSQGADNLTNSVYAITNYMGYFNNLGNQTGSGSFGYTYYGATSNNVAYDFHRLTNGANIIGVLSTPQFVDNNNRAVSDINGVSYTSNHITAYVRSISGLAAEKPPQDNPIMRDDSFTYRVYCVNAAMALFSPPLWVAGAYNVGDNVSYVLNGQVSYWVAISAFESSDKKTLPPQPTDVPNASVRWQRNFYPQELADNMHELRLTFLWPQLPNGNVGGGRQTFRASVAGQLTADANGLFFYHSQYFTNAP